MSWDTIVIGSGVGGMCAAVTLARNGHRVLVLEQHYLPGGWTQSFTLDQYRFSPGVHYIGDLHEGGGVRRIFEGLGVTRDLEFCQLNPHGYDHLLIGGERFDVPAGFERYVGELVQRFPSERDGLLKYFSTLQRVTDDIRRCEPYLAFPKLLTLPFRAPSLMTSAFARLEPLLRRTIHDPLLRGILTAPCGNHGLSPSRVSLPAHAFMIEHYFNGGYYPRGGAKAIPAAFIKELRRNRGCIRTRTRVAEILVERGRAVGVLTADGERIDADFVVSNADPAVTYGRLVKAATPERRRSRRMEYSVSMVSLFVAVDLDLRAMGYDSGNYWWFRTDDVGGVYERMERELPGDHVDGMFLTITTLKNPEELRHGHHTLEMFTYVPYAPFARWAGGCQGDRGEEYGRFKRLLAEKILRSAEHVIPGIERAVKFLEVGTPVTNGFYCESHRGAALGTAKTPFQLGPFSFGIGSSIRNLFNCGASTLSHGVGGAAISGVAAAQRVLGRERVDDVLAPVDGSTRIYPCEQASAWARVA